MEAKGSKNASDLVTESNKRERNKKKKKKGILIEGFQINGISIAGHETCIRIDPLNLVFDIGRCPQFAISQQFLFISHAHMDQSELKHNLICLNVGEELCLRKDLKVKAFKTYHTIPSQGYIVYSVKQKLKQEYIGLPGNEIKNLKSSGVEITDTTIVPEVAFTGDTTSDFIVDEDNSDVLRSKVLIMESTYVTDLETVENARDYGHTHLSEIISHADRFQNKAILLIHFSARYQADEIQTAMLTLPPSLAGRTFTLLEGF